MTAHGGVAVILAGGRGERLGGVIKANLRIGGVPLLTRVTGAIGDLAAATLVAHGGIDPEAMALGPEHIPIADLPFDYGGPLAGVAAAVDWCTRQPQPAAYLLSVAVDTPFFPADFLARSLAAIAPGRSAVTARCAGQDYPTDSLWRLSAVRALPDAVRAGTAPRSLRRYAAAIGAMPFDWPADEAGDPFISLNTEEDRLMLEARATGGGKR